MNDRWSNKAQAEYAVYCLGNDLTDAITLAAHLGERDVAALVAYYQRLGEFLQTRKRSEGA